jgi:hypothetical protein
MPVICRRIVYGRCSVRIFLVMMVVSVFAMGCSQMRHAGRYQEVMIESQPEGAAVLLEGNIEAAPVAIKMQDGLQLVYASPLQLRTPVKLILDKENQYRVRVVAEGYPEYEKELVPHFAFHPYLIITFPVVPFWSNYEIKRFDDVAVDFEAYKAELEAEKLAEEEAAAAAEAAAEEEEAAEEEPAEEEQPAEEDEEKAPAEQPEKGD